MSLYARTPVTSEIQVSNSGSLSLPIGDDISSRIGDTGVDGGVLLVVSAPLVAGVLLVVGIY